MYQISACVKISKEQTSVSNENSNDHIGESFLPFYNSSKCDSLGVVLSLFSKY